MKIEYVVALEAVKETVWLWKFLMGLGVVLLVVSPLILFCNNKEAVAQSKEP